MAIVIENSNQNWRSGGRTDGGQKRGQRRGGRKRKKENERIINPKRKIFIKKNTNQRTFVCNKHLGSYNNVK